MSKAHAVNEQRRRELRLGESNVLGGKMQRGEQFIPERRSQAKHLEPSLGFGDSCLPPFDPQPSKGLDCSDFHGMAWFHGMA